MNSKNNSKLLDEVKRLFANAKGCHDWDHTERVLNLCMKIGEKEEANLKILFAAAALHDIGREEELRTNRKIDHAEYGADLAKSILGKYNYSDNEIEEISCCIRTHRYRGDNIPKSLEAKILYDSDKIDSIGAIGIGRAFHFASEIGARVHGAEITLENSTEFSRDDTAYRHYLDKLCKINDKLFTAEGKKIAEGRQQFMKIFFDRLNQEATGKL